METCLAWIGLKFEISKGHHEGSKFEMSAGRRSTNRHFPHELSFPYKMFVHNSKADSFCHQYKQQNYSHDLAKWQYLKRLKCSTESHISVPMKIRYFAITLVSNINFNLGNRFTKLVLQYVQRLSLSFLQTCSGFSKK